MSPEFVIALLEAYRYWILFPLACIEGPIVSLITGFLIATDFFSFWPAFLVLIPGDVLPDTIYYCIGKYAGNSPFALRNRHKIGLHSERIGRIELLWKDHPIKLMMISKWAYGISTPLLISAGISRVSFPFFFVLSLVLSIIQYSLLLFLGWRFGESIQSIANSFEVLSVGFTVMIVIFGVCYRIFTRYVRTMFQRE